MANCAPKHVLLTFVHYDSGRETGREKEREEGGRQNKCPELLLFPY